MGAKIEKECLSSDSRLKPLKSLDSQKENIWISLPFGLEFPSRLIWNSFRWL